jgi:hypothetical protein
MKMRALQVLPGRSTDQIELTPPLEIRLQHWLIRLSRGCKTWAGHETLVIVAASGAIACSGTAMRQPDDARQE